MSSFWWRYGHSFSTFCKFFCNTQIFVWPWVAQVSSFSMSVLFMLDQDWKFIFNNIVVKTKNEECKLHIFLLGPRKGVLAKPNFDQKWDFPWRSIHFLKLHNVIIAKRRPSSSSSWPELALLSLFPSSNPSRADPSRNSFQSGLVSSQGVKESRSQGVKESSSQAVRQSSSQAVKQSNSQAVKQSNSQAVKQSSSQAVKQLCSVAVMQLCSYAVMQLSS